jgi:poly-gamma-glutamate synthesis protein (capsule biosynthesis protein)
VSIANNHLMDYGVEGLKSTLQALDDAGIIHVGAGMDADTACAPAYMDVADNKFAFLGRSSVVVSSPCYATAGRPGRNGEPHLYHARQVPEPLVKKEKET